MTFGSLFAGIGGFDLGLERAGMRCQWQVEVDPYCRNILQRHWPEVPKRGDIRLVDPADLAPVDLICGGFPCQDLSSAGKRVGITGWRSGLWKEMLRVVSGLRPRWVVVENVPALRTRGADVVCGDLEAEGYAVWPVVVGAWAVGAPHRRDRVWIVGHAGHGREPDGAWTAGREAGERPAERSVSGSDGRVANAECGILRDEPRGCSGSSRSSEAVARTDGMADRDESRLEGRRLRGGERAHEWPARPGCRQAGWEAPRTIESPVGRSVDGVSRRLALKALGNAIVPQVAEVIGRAILSAEIVPVGELKPVTGDVNPDHSGTLTDPW